MKSWTELYNKQVDEIFYLDNIANHKVFLNSILKEKPRRTLEVGVGTGTFSIFLSHLGIEAHALDSNPTIIEVAKRTANKFNVNVKFIVGNAFNLQESLEANFYDVIFHQGLLEHFLDIDIVSLLRQQLRLGKVVIFSVPTPEYGKQDLGNERLLSPFEWLDLLRTYDFNVIECCTYFDVLSRPKILKLPKYVRFKHLAFMVKLTQ